MPANTLTDTEAASLAMTLAQRASDEDLEKAREYLENALELRKSADDEPCLHCGGNGLENWAERRHPCLGCHGEGRMPKGYRRDRELVVEALHHGGRYRRQLTEKQWQDAYLLADGFGDLNAQAGGGRSYAEGAEWDWSHVRDSSPAAVAAMAEYLRTVLGRNATGRTA